jgi:hypothetical protein
MSWDFWGSALSISRRPSSATSRPGLDCHQTSKETTTHTSTTGNRTFSTAPRIHRRLVIDVTTTPQGWPTCTRAHRYSSTDGTQSAFFSKAPPRISCKPYSPLESIKGEGKEHSRGDRGQQKTKKQDIASLLRSTSQAILHYTLSSRLGTGSLSHSL